LTFKKGVTPKGAKPFPKGVSGNPAGRPPGSHICDDHQRAALQFNLKTTVGSARSGFKAEDALRRLLARGDLPHIISGVTVSGGVRTDHHWLGRRSLLPRIESDLGIPAIIAEGDDDAPTLTCKEVEPNVYAIR
jgi:hypothetical protein